MKITRNNKRDWLETIKYNSEFIITVIIVGIILAAFLWVLFNVAYPAV